MCGIVGKISFSHTPVKKSAIHSMTSAIAHRGPDDFGTYVSTDSRVGLGHARLAIIDTSARGHQPMTYKERYTIVFNGEIYNYQHLRKWLLGQGYVFSTETDTEVITALYDKYKEGCLMHLRGMFAFAVYDNRENILFCARDRVGKKPFKYFMNDTVFMFASELKAILTQSEYKKEPDYTAIHHYLTYQYCPAPFTGFKHIKKLKPGHFMRVDLNTREVIIKNYWHLNFSNKQNFSESEWRQQLLESLEESVRLRMISDVPIGAFLSGGIDSSAVVALMARNSKRPIKTFSIGFAEDAFNELPFAKQVATHLHTDHTEFVVKPETIDILPHLVSQYEEPYADSSALPTYFLSEQTRKFVKVALNGDGGDENFAGYPRYNIHKLSLVLDHIPVALRSAAEPLLRSLLGIRQNTFMFRSHRFAESWPQPYAQRYVSYLCYFTDVMKNALYTDTMKKILTGVTSHSIYEDAFKNARTPDPLDQMLFADISSYLPDDLLVKVDIASMAHGLEARSPFLDHKFMELAASMPNTLKLKGFFQNKYMLKQIMTDILPPAIIQRKKKGFVVPIDAWFKGGLHSYVADLLLSPNTHVTKTIAQESSIRELLHLHKNTKINVAPQLWALTTLELWFREHFS